MPLIYDSAVDGSTFDAPWNMSRRSEEPQQTTFFAYALAGANQPLNIILVPVEGGSPGASISNDSTSRLVVSDANGPFIVRCQATGITVGSYKVYAQ